MKIVISPRAEKQLRKASKINRIAIVKKIRSLPDSKSQAEKLKGFKNIERVRVGKYRIVYKRTQVEIFIIVIGHRREIYEQLKRLLK